MISKISFNLQQLRLIPNEFLTEEYKKPKFLLGFLSNNRVEYLLTEIACMSTSIVTVGLYNKLDNFVDFAFWLSLKYLFCPAEFLEGIISLQKKNEISLELVIVCDSVSPEVLLDCNNLNIQVVRFEELVEGQFRGEEGLIDLNDPYCLSLTSGATGQPKFCIITHLNIISTVSSSLYLSQEMTTEDSYLSYLNFSVLSEKIFIFLVSASGGKIGIAKNSIDFKKDSKYLKPTFMVAVPRLLEFLYNSIKKQTDALKGLSRSMYTKAFTTKLKNYEKNGELKHKI